MQYEIINIFRQPLNRLAIVIVLSIICIQVRLYLIEINEKRAEKRAAKIRFNNRLKLVAHEVKVNFCYAENPQKPFHTKALKKLLFSEPLIHNYPLLFDNAKKCLIIALTLSSRSQTKLKAEDGHLLMKELSQHLSESFGIKIED